MTEKEDAGVTRICRQRHQLPKLQGTTTTTAPHASSHLQSDPNSPTLQKLLETPPNTNTPTMSLLPSLLTLLVALLHVYILALESYFWTTPRGRKAFGTTPAFAEQTKALAANQGLYNGFLAAGLAWGLLHPVQGVGVQIQAFFLGCVAVAGVVGAWTTGKGRIMLIQTAPAVLAGAALWVF